MSDKPKATTPKHGQRAPSKARSDIWVKPLTWKAQAARPIVVEIRKSRRPK